MEDLARLAKGRVIAAENFARPFSNFQFLLQNGWFTPSIRRVFSEARRSCARSFAIEELESSRETEDETTELSRLDPAFRESVLTRITFWAEKWESHADYSPPADALLGYMILRSDSFSDQGEPAVHVFESVFRKFDHFHNFIPCETTFNLCCGDSLFNVAGVMYCQQNGRTKACAQVALRSLLATHFSGRPIFYSEINSIAGQLTPANGLSSEQIRNVLEAFGINYREIDYTTEEANRENIPYGKLLYAGLENGCGGLLGFTLAGPTADSAHIIPFFGHTFNQDTWAPRAQNAYFHVGSELAYIPSDEWVSSFVGHDDNFGSNYCVPKRFVGKERVDYVVALLPGNVKTDPLQAEVAGASVLYTLFDFVPRRFSRTLWHKALAAFVEMKDVVLRTHAIDRDAYHRHLENLEDWDGETIGDDVRNFTRILPESLWMIELSIPELFATNYAKLGEIIIAGDAEFDTTDDMTEEELLRMYLDKVVLARFPGVILIRLSSADENGDVRFVPVECRIKGHSPLLGVPAYRVT